MNAMVSCWDLMSGPAVPRQQQMQVEKKVAAAQV
jgi:hypothetical protein